MAINTFYLRFYLRKTLFLPFAVFWIVSTCSFSQNIERIRMVYQETVCGPEWIVFQKDDSTFFKLKQLLLKDSVLVFNIKYTGKLFECTCAGCGCLTGRNLEIIILRKDQQKAEALEFQRPWAWMDKIEKVCDWTMDLDDEQIREKLSEKQIRAFLVAGTGLSEKKSDNCTANSGRTLTIKVDRDDLKSAEKEGFILNKTFKEY